ncbi:MAG: N-glycosylase/DNA lyase [Candidatus Hodarchaeota archaeon]
MERLTSSIETLKHSEVKTLVDNRISEFMEFMNKSVEEIFKELCFCIMTANCSAEKCIEVHEKIENRFLSFTEDQLITKFKELGYRFPNVRANYIVQARNKMMELENALKSEENDVDLRDWIVRNIKGIGYKEASHFLRNIGFSNYAIIDFHIIDILAKHKLIDKPKYLTKTRYIEIESVLERLGKKTNLTLAELDLYLWYMETTKILK